MINSHRIQLSQVRMHYVEAGDPAAPALVLLHGWPQTWMEWEGVIPALAARYRVIAPDLRGLGDSSRPQVGYDTLSVAGDLIELLDRLGIATAGIVGHDIGALVAYALAASRGERVRALAILDVVLPGYSLEKLVQLGKDGWGIWHFPFHASPVAEFLIQGRERSYLEWFFRNMAYRPNAIPTANVDAYVRAYSAPGAMRAGLAYYAAFHEDGVQNRRLGERKLKMPVLAIGGSASVGHMVADEMRQVADNVTADVAPDSGHWIPEEQGPWLVERLLKFFAAA
jgi:pimeloyl-ACP methyl ester carboxylesterase